MRNQSVTKIGATHPTCHEPNYPRHCKLRYRYSSLTKIYQVPGKTPETLPETCSFPLVTAQFSGLHLCPDKSLFLAENWREGGVLHYGVTTDSLGKLASCGTEECHSVDLWCLCDAVRFGVLISRTTSNEKSRRMTVKLATLWMCVERKLSVWFLWMAVIVALSSCSLLALLVEGTLRIHVCDCAA